LYYQIFKGLFQLVQDIGLEEFGSLGKSGSRVGIFIGDDQTDNIA
jgi:hypothetical protein